MVHSPLYEHRPQFLLVQARSSSSMEQQEQTCFAERCRAAPEQFRLLNVGRGDDPTPVALENVDALLIGGAGRFSATDDHDWTESLFELIRRAVQQELPTFGSCWGHQIIARALGGRVVHDPEQAELGCRWVQLTRAGEDDPLFGRFPSRFKANMGHHDRVVELPPDAVELARNDQPHQAFRLRNRPVYGTQFHSELDAQRERERILKYREQYRKALPDEATMQEVISNLAETTEVDSLLYDFLTTFVTVTPPSSAPEKLRPPSDERGKITRRVVRALTAS